MPEVQKTQLVSVIVRCFNEEKHIGNLLEALTQQTEKNHEVILVDSGSTDSTLDIARKYSVRIVNISPKDFTFGYSLNRGCIAASGEFFVIASAHVLPMNKIWLEELMKPFRDEKVAIVYGRQVGNSVTKFSEHQVFMQQFPPESNFKQNIPFCNNANAAIRKSVWQQHPYDETLTGLEDLEMGKWAIANGYLLSYNAEAAIIHIHEETPNKIFIRYKREAIALKKIFPDTHLYFFEFVSFWFFTTALDLLRAMKHGRFFSSCSEIIMFRTMQYWGTYQGIHDRSPLTHEMILKFYYPRKPQRFKKNRS